MARPPSDDRLRLPDLASPESAVLFGKVDRFAGCYVATRFFHVNGFPLLPLESALVFEEAGAAPMAEPLLAGARRLLPSGDDRAVSYLPVPLDLRSVALTYLRFYGSIAVATWLAVALVGGGLASRLAVLPLLALVLASWRWLGQPSRAEKAKRSVYWDYVGQFVDVARLGDGRTGLAERLRREVVLRAGELAAVGYRESFDPETGWRQLAADPRVRDAAFLRPALALSRIEWSLARGRERARLARVHERIFQNLEAAQPALLAEVDRYSLK